MQTSLFFVVLIFLTYFSVRKRAHVLSMRQAQGDAGGVPFEPKPSPISQAILDIGGVAGGIYIAVTALSAFLKLEIPPRISVGGVSFDPIALVSLVSAVLWAAFQSTPQPITSHSSKNRLRSQQESQVRRIKGQVGTQIGHEMPHGCGGQIGQAKG
ncbi:MAG TPA: hypothetical protein GX507_08585 [Clostridia bacterium]|nr:hypothetical protein [Clostridia bacterium]